MAVSGDEAALWGWNGSVCEDLKTLAFEAAPEKSAAGGSGERALFLWRTSSGLSGAVTPALCVVPLYRWRADLGAEAVFISEIYGLDAGYRLWSAVKREEAVELLRVEVSPQGIVTVYPSGEIPAEAGPLSLSFTRGEGTLVDTQSGRNWRIDASTLHILSVEEAGSGSMPMAGGALR